MKQVFLDTSIQIARLIREPEMRQRINSQIAQYDVTVSSLIVRQEFKRRLLKEAQYLLNQFNDKGSFEKVRRHIESVLPQPQQRKRNICLGMLSTIFEQANEEELVERAKSYLRTLLRLGLADFDRSVNKVIQDSDCACALLPIKEKKEYKEYEFGTDKCSAVNNQCGISGFLNQRQATVKIIDSYLKELPVDKKSNELQATETFIEKSHTDAIAVENLNPCLTVGDFLIALESKDVPNFYTLNSKESQHLCRPLNQSLVVRPNNPALEDIVCLSTDDSWREF